MTPAALPKRCAVCGQAIERAWYDPDRGREVVSSGYQIVRGADLARWDAGVEVFGYACSPAHADALIARLAATRREAP